MYCMYMYIYVMYICVCVYIYIYIYIYTYIYTHTHNNIFFIYSSVDGHYSCIHILAIVNNAAMNIEMHVSFQIK